MCACCVVMSAMDCRGYREIRALGNGASSEVWLVSQDDRKYVLKKIAADVPEFAQEVSILRTLPLHPCIVGLREVFVETETATARPMACLVLEYCDSGDLYTYIHSRGPVKSEICGLDWTLQISLGLSFLHLHKIVYRDLKSLNVFLVRAKNQFYPDGSRKYLAKLGDYGVSKKLQSKKEFLTTQTGTPLNMAPELFLSQPYSFSIDIWALGCLVYEIFHAHSPFEADSFLAVRKKVLYDRPAAMNETLDIETRKLIHTLLNKDAEKRPQAQDMFRFPCLLNRLSDVLHSYGSVDRAAQDQLVRQLCDHGHKDLVPTYLYAHAYHQVLKQAIVNLRKIEELRETL